MHIDGCLSAYLTIQGNIAWVMVCADDNTFGLNVMNPWQACQFASVMFRSISFWRQIFFSAVRIVCAEKTSEDLSQASQFKLLDDHNIEQAVGNAGIRNGEAELSAKDGGVDDGYLYRPAIEGIFCTCEAGDYDSMIGFLGAGKGESLEF